MYTLDAFWNTNHIPKQPCYGVVFVLIRIYFIQKISADSSTVLVMSIFFTRQLYHNTYSRSHNTNTILSSVIDENLKHRLKKIENPRHLRLHFPWTNMQHYIFLFEDHFRAFFVWSGQSLRTKNRKQKQDISGRNW